MLEVGLTYKAINGRSFRILTKKKVAASNGCNFIGEDVANGKITYFNDRGVNCFHTDYDLKVDKYKWLPIYDDGTLGLDYFGSRDEVLSLMVMAPSGFLRMENDNIRTVAYVDKKMFDDFYS
jgi:hypothetical protein